MTPTPPNANPMGRYTVQQASAMLGVARQTVYNWLNARAVFRPSEVDCGATGRHRVRIKGSAINRVWAAST